MDEITNAYQTLKRNKTTRKEMLDFFNKIFPINEEKEIHKEFCADCGSDQIDVEQWAHFTSRGALKHKDKAITGYSCLDCEIIELNKQLIKCFQCNSMKLKFISKDKQSEIDALVSVYSNCVFYCFDCEEEIGFGAISHRKLNHFNRNIHQKTKSRKVCPGCKSEQVNLIQTWLKKESVSKVKNGILIANKKYSVLNYYCFSCKEMFKEKRNFNAILEKHFNVEM